MKHAIKDLQRLEYKPKNRKFLTDDEIAMLPAGSAVTCDVEDFRNFFFVGFKHIDTDSYFFEEKSDWCELNVDRLRWIMWRFELTTFNGKSYDIRMLEKAMKGGSLDDLKELSDGIILRDERDFKESATFNHVDLIEVAPLEGSLKLYAARLHCERMQELPIDPHKRVTFEEAQFIKEYNFNDLDNTALLRQGLADPLRLRASLSKQYEEDWRSKSDAQIAEALVSAEFEKLTGRRPQKTKLPRDYSFKYVPPDNIKFRTPLLQKTLEAIKDVTFTLDENGYVRLPKEIENLSLNIGNGCYRMSIGGLHSSETCMAIKTDEDTLCKDVDVTSYYPFIILNGGIEPKNMQGVFLKIYKKLVDLRVALKAVKNPDADGYKIGVNGIFGKLGSPWSIMYSPDLMIYVTLTGQLSLLMLIEEAALNRFEVLSANTDGVLFKCPRTRNNELDAIVKMWEATTGFPTEEVRYAGYYARDVNNYIATKLRFDKETKQWTNEIEDCKAKGTYSEKGSALNSVLSKNPEALICSDAVKALVSKGIPIEQTICQCTDMRRFVCVRNVKGGAHKDGVYLGRVVRWYYAQNEYGTINYILSGNTVANTEGAVPFMELGPMPSDINLKWYLNKAFAILNDIGYNGRNTQRTLFE